VMAESGAGEQLSVGDDGHDEYLTTGQLADPPIGGRMEGVVTVKEADDRDRVE
jgi:hypothetical protein